MGELVAWKNFLYSLFFILMDLGMRDLIHRFEVSLLIFRLDVDNG